MTTPVRLEIRESDEEVLAGLQKRIDELGITNASVVSVIGAFDTSCIHTMLKDDATGKLMVEINEPCELSGSGEVVDGQLHLHVVLGAQGGTTYSGHLEWAYAKTWFTAVVVMPF